MRCVSLLIAFEGLDGAGKSTQLRLLADYLTRRGLTPLVVREPGSTKVGERIRNLVLTEEMSPATESLLLAAARRELYEEIKSAPLVLSDRWVYSSWVYQGIARGVGLDFVKQINDVPRADLLILLDLPLSVSLERMSKSDRIEQAGLDFYRKVAEGYRSLKSLPETLTFDATLTTGLLHQSILDKILPLLES